MISTVLVVIVVVVALLLVGARLFGLQVYAVLSGSMEPTYHVGSVIYVEPVDPSEVKVGPKTGDDTPVALYAAICAVCAGAVMFLIATRKKKEQ